MSEQKTDALSELLNETQGQQAEQASGDLAALLARMEAQEKRMEALQAENDQLKARQSAIEKKKTTPASVQAKPYAGPVTMLIHPHYGHEVPVKDSLVESFIAQGYKEPKPTKKK